MRSHNRVSGSGLTDVNGDAWLAAIVESSKDAIIGQRVDGIVESWNRGAELLYGYPASEIIGRSIAVLAPPECVQEEASLLGRIENGEAIQYLETVRLRKDGEQVYVSLAISPILNKSGQVIGASHVARDITARVNYEHAVARLAAIVGSSQDAIISKSLEGIIQTWNAGAERVYGYTAEEVVGRSMASLLPDSLLEEERDILSRMSRGERIQHFETVRVHKEGRLVPVSLTVSPILTADDKIAGISHVARDVSAELQLKDKRQLSQKMEAVGRLAGGVAHDFNNLLTIIGGYGAMLQTSIREDKAQAEMVDEIMAAAERAADLTRQLLAFSRRQVVRLQPLDLNETLSKMKAMLQRLIREDINIELVLGAGLRPVQADPGQVSQIIMNLTANARDAMPNGGKIVIRTANWTVEQDRFHEELGFTPGHYVRLMFSDTGEGMDADTCKHIFEPFFTTKEVGRGTGLGLSTVYGIVKQSGGHISVYSELGSGSTFSIYLPCAALPPSSSEAVQAQPAKGSETILLVEDEPRLRRLAVSILTAGGYSVLSAGNAQEALEQVRNHSGKIQMILTDMVMPGMNGQALVSEITTKRPEIRHAFMSGYTEHTTIEGILSEPGAAFIQKPFTPAQLLQKVRDVLDR